jgi:hypothetical protein
MSGEDDEDEDGNDDDDDDEEDDDEDDDEDDEVEEDPVEPPQKTVRGIKAAGAPATPAPARKVMQVIDSVSGCLSAQGCQSVFFTCFSHVYLVFVEMLKAILRMPFGYHIKGDIPARYRHLS